MNLQKRENRVIVIIEQIEKGGRIDGWKEEDTICCCKEE